MAAPTRSPPTDEDEVREKVTTEPLGERRRMRAQVTGSIQIRSHCEFTWRQPEGSFQRIIDVRPEHCRACIESLIPADGFVVERRQK